MLHGVLRTCSPCSMSTAARPQLRCGMHFAHSMDLRKAHPAVHAAHKPLLLLLHIATFQ